MRQRTRGIAGIALMSLALLALGCNKGPAEAALKAADEALAAARPEVQRYVPEELTSLDAAVQAARSELEKGNYTEALKAAQRLPERIQAAVDAAAERKAQLTATWTALTVGLPGLVQSITEKVTALAAARSLPKGMTKDALASARADLESVSEAWTAATAAFQGGDIPRAVETAQDVKGRAEALARTLGLSPPPAARP
jgi:acetylornithine deacetylase/succinyl-diaminopimelate desuccinylase-like protein